MAAPGCTGCTGCTGCIGHILHLLTPSFWPLLRNCRQIHLKTTYQIDLQTDANGKQSSTLASSPGTPHPGDLRPGTSARVHLPRHCLEIPTRMTFARGRVPHAQGAGFHMPYGNRPWHKAMASGRQALEPSGRLSLGGHGERKDVLRGTGIRIRCAST